MRRVTIIVNVNLTIVNRRFYKCFNRRFGNAAFFRVQKFVIGHVSYVFNELCSGKLFNVYSFCTPKKAALPKRRLKLL